MYTIIGHPQNRSVRVMWMLEELGEPYEFELAGPQSERLRALNPTGKAPVLLVDDEPIADSVAILTFLGDLHGKLTHPAGTVARARQDAATQFCVDEIEGACWTAAKNRFLHPEDKRASVEPTCRFEFDMAMERLAAKLGDGPFLMGETFTLADILTAHSIGWGERMFKWPLPAGPVVDYARRCADRPARAAAIARGKQVVEAAAA